MAAVARHRPGHRLECSMMTPTSERHLELKGEIFVRNMASTCKEQNDVARKFIRSIMTKKRAFCCATTLSQVHFIHEKKKKTKLIEV